MFQHSSANYENLNGSDYDLILRNGDTDRSISFIVRAIGSSPELQLDDGKVILLGNLETTHVDVSGSQRVLINNPDTDGFIRLSNSNLSRLDATNSGVDVYGDLSYTGSLIPASDKKSKKDIKELNSKKAVELIKYIKCVFVRMLPYPLLFRLQVVTIMRNVPMLWLKVPLRG